MQEVGYKREKERVQERVRSGDDSFFRRNRLIEKDRAESSNGELATRTAWSVSTMQCEQTVYISVRVELPTTGNATSPTI